MEGDLWLGWEISKWAELGGPSGSGKPSLHRAKLPFKRPGLGLYKKKGKWVVIVRPNNLKGLKKGLAQESIQDSILGLPAFKSGELKTELQRPSFAGESSEKKVTPLDQGNRESPLKSHSLGMFPRSTAFGGVSREFFGFSSPSTSRMGDSVEYPLAWQFEVTCDNHLEAEVPLRVILKDGRSFTLPERVTPKSRGKELQMPPLHITVAGEGEKKKFLGFCKTVGVLIEGFEDDILRILKEIDNRRGVIRKPNDSKRGTLSASREKKELKKLVSTINYDGLAGREAEEGKLGRQITVVPYEA